MKHTNVHDAAFTHIVGIDHVITPGDDRHRNGIEPRTDGLEAASVDGVNARWTVFPGSADEVARVMTHAHAHDLAVVVTTGGTRLRQGNPPRQLDVALSLRRLNNVVAYEPADMTVTVQAGMRLSDLQRHLLTRNQMLPIDAPVPKEATVGGLVATAEVGPLSAAFQTVPDHVLGMEVVSAAGVITRSGGRVVKNVTGYEMGRLYTGSFGTLAVITEVTFKVQPVFETGVIARFDLEKSEQVKAAIDALLGSNAAPVLIDITGPRPLTLWAGYAGTKEQVAWMVEKSLPNTVPAGTSYHIIPWSDGYDAVVQSHRPDADPTVFQGVIDDGARNGTEDANVLSARGGSAPILTVIATVSPSNVPALIAQFDENAAPEGLTCAFAAHGATGVVRVHVIADNTAAPAPSDADQLATLVDAWRGHAESMGGRLVVASASPAVKQKAKVWGDPGDDFFLHRAIKNKIDPKGTLSPGRFIGGL